MKDICGTYLDAALCFWINLKVYGVPLMYLH
jgi:hypothetical protein